MERPWMILCRVLHVVPPGDGDVQADAGDNAAAGDGEDAQAQDEQHDGVGEAGDGEDDAQALDEQHDAVGEAGDALAQDEQHAGDEEDEEDDAQAQDEQHDGAGEAGDAQAQDEQHAGDEEDEEEDAAAENVALGPQANLEDAQAQDEQHAGDEEDEEDVAAVNVALDPQAQLEEGILDANTNILLAGWLHAVMLAAVGGPFFTMTVAPPPGVSSLAAGPGSHPDPEGPDMYPYIVATGRFCLLVHFAIAPNYGTNFDQQPADDSHLVVVRHFRRGGDDGAQIAACMEDVPDRPEDENDDIPALANIASVGLVCNQETGHYLIAELIVTTGDPEAVVVYIATDTGEEGWEDNYYPNPFGVNNQRQWVPHGTVTVNTTVCWFDLSWGIISCNLADPHAVPPLNFHRLPPGRELRAGAGAGAGAVADRHGRRCIAVSENLLRYVEIIFHPHQAARVKMWYRDLEAIPLMWRTNYSESFADIWANESYANTGLPQNPPMLVGVSPVNSNVVYFSLNHRLFGVNVPEHTVVHCEEYQPLNRPLALDDEPVTSRYLITWNLDADQAPNVGHQPDEPSDHEDSSESGPMDEGDIDYETPSE